MTEDPAIVIQAKPEPSSKERLIEAARTLFAKQGIEGVSLREITRSAGQGNTRAVQYHFGSRLGLLTAVLEPFEAEVSARRASLLESLSEYRNVSMGDLAEALVRPSAAMLETADGKEYLLIAAELVRDPRRFGDELEPIRSGIDSWARLAKGHMPEAVSPLHRRFAAIQLCSSELARRAATRRRSDHRLFVSDLIDLVAAILGAPVSDETGRLLAERDSGRAKPTR